MIKSNIQKKIVMFVALALFLIGVSAPHANNLEDLSKLPKSENIYIDILLVKLFNIAEKNLRENGHEIENYEQIIVVKEKHGFFSVFFNLKGFNGFGGNAEFPNWQVIIHGKTLHILYSGYPRV